MEKLRCFLVDVLLLGLRIETGNDLGWKTNQQQQAFFLKAVINLDYAKFLRASKKVPFIFINYKNIFCLFSHVCILFQMYFLNVKNVSFIF